MSEKFKVVIFGTGQFYKHRKSLISNEIETVGFIDNNEDLSGTEIDGVKIYLPQ